jgi:imidazolonepropionase-like amidohydrolase
MRAPADAGHVVRELKEAGADFVKVKSHMMPDSLRALCQAAAEADLPVSFDSDGGSSYAIMDALDGGARGVEHLSGINFEVVAEREKALRKMLEVRAFAVPTFAVLGRTYGNSRLSARREFIRKFARRGGIVVAGSDTPTQGTPAGASLHEELQYLTEAGLTPLEAIVAATGAAGRALGYQGRVGTIEAGAWADLLIVRGAPHENISATLQIERVLKGGLQVYPPPPEEGR